MDEVPSLQHWEVCYRARQKVKSRGMDNFGIDEANWWAQNFALALEGKWAKTPNVCQTTAYGADVLFLRRGYWVRERTCLLNSTDEILGPTV